MSMRAGQLVSVRNPGRFWFPPRPASTWYLLAVIAALAGVLWITDAILRADYVSVVVGAVYLVAAASYLYRALLRRRRDQRAHDQAMPAPAPEVLVLAGHGQKIQAIRRYRQLNPRIRLKEAKDVIDRL